MDRQLLGELHAGMEAQQVTTVRCWRGPRWYAAAVVLKPEEPEESENYETVQPDNTTGKETQCPTT